MCGGEAAPFLTGFSNTPLDLIDTLLPSKWAVTNGTELDKEMHPRDLRLTNAAQRRVMTPTNQERRSWSMHYTASIEDVKISNTKLRQVAREAVAKIYAEKKFGSNEISPPGTLRGIDVLPRGTITQKLSRSHIISWGKYQRRIDIFNPKTFFEKINIAKLFAPVLMPSPADKLAVGTAIPSGLEGDVKTVPVHWRTAVPMSTEELLNQDLPTGTYFAKSNCGAQNNLRVTLPFETPDQGEMFSKLMHSWLNGGHGTAAGEWWYSLIRPQVFIEEDLTLNDEPPMDWKFHCVGGRVAICQLDIGRGANHFQEIYDRDFRYLPHRLFFKTSQSTEKPKNFGFLVEAAEAIAKRFEFARIDFYNHQGTVYLGEVTLAPFGGQRMPLSPELDHYIGERWVGTRLFPN